jgi:hypothetical protein
LAATRTEPFAELTSVGGWPWPPTTAAVAAVNTLRLLPVLAWPGTRLLAVLSKATVPPSPLRAGAVESPLAGAAGAPPLPLTRKFVPATAKPGETLLNCHK